MITIYEKNETNFDHNGLGVLDDNIISPIVHETLNGLFSFAFDYPIHGSKAKFLLAENIVKAPVPDMPDQLFRIIERSDAQGMLLHIVAHHIFYDLAKNLIEDTFIVNKTGTQAIGQLLSSTQFTHQFTGTSNITSVNNARLVRLNPVEVLLDAGLDNGYLSRWGGEIVRDNYHISMLTQRGSNNGVQIRDKKNLTGYQADVDYSSIVTRIMPEGTDGLFLPEKYVDSPLINQYVSPKIKVIKYDIKVGEDEGDYPTADLAYAALRESAQAEFDSNNLDKPVATYEVNFAPLENTEEYKVFAQLETINLGDTVQVIHEEDVFYVTARMTSYQYNPMTKAYISITLGNVIPKFTDIAKDIKKVDVKVDRAQDEANYALTAANGKNTNFYGTALPSNPRLGDVWYKENGDKLEMWVYENREGVTQWYPLMTDLTQEVVKQELAEAAAEVEIAKQKAEEAEEMGKDLANQMQDAKTAIEDTINAAADAVDKANSAVSNADTALVTAQNAHAKSVKSSSVTYQVSTSGTNTPTGTWLTTIPSLSAGQYLWTRTVFTLQDNSATTAYSVSMKGLTGDVGSKGDKGDTGETGTSGIDAPTITKVQDQFYLSTSDTAQEGGSWGVTVPTWNSDKYYWSRVATTYSDNTATYSTAVLDAALNQALVTSLEVKTTATALQTTITQHATQIALKASQSSVDGLTGRLITAETSLTQQAGMIQLKANQTEVDRVTTDVTTIESAITQMATDINLRVSKDDIVNQINLSSEGILISANKLTLAMTGNLIQNSEFNSNVWNEGWTNVNPNNPFLRGATYTDTQGGASDSTVVDTSDLELYPSPATAQLYQAFPVQAGSYYSFSFMIALTNRTSGTAYGMIRFYDSNNTLLTSTSSVAHNSLTTPLWIEKKLENILAPTGAVQARFYYQVGGNMRVLFTRTMVNLGTKVMPYSSTSGQVMVSGNMVVAGAITGDKITVDTGFFNKINALSGNFTNVNAGKITTGTLSADRIAAGSITSAKLTIANGYIINAMISDATITSAKIANLDAGKITTGTLSAARIAASSITADKLAANILTAITALSSIRITGTTIGYYDNGTLVTQINSQGLIIRRNNLDIGHIGASSYTDHSDWRGLRFGLDYDATYLAWSHQDAASDTNYTTKLTWFARDLESGKEKGFHFSDDVYFNQDIRLSGMMPTNNSSWGLNIIGRTVGGNGGVSILDDTNKCGIHITASEVFFLRDNKYYSLGDILRGSTWSV
ncbi:MAG: phage tail protein [Streptococcaceae bacterium]|jgi:phage minor structural protein|nr:phage tail protein [Streptococcaceae bacterium]